MLAGKQIVESRMKQIETERDALLSDPTIKRYLSAVSESVQDKKGREMTLHEQRVVAQCLRNAIDDAAMRSSKPTLSETTTEDAVSFLGVQLPVIAALLPSLVLPEVGIVQAMDRRTAAVFYFDVKYGSTKGAVTAGDTMLSATTGHATSKSGRMYAIARVVDETIGTSDGTKSGTLEYAPGLINLENIKFESVSGSTRTTLGTSNASGTVTGDYVTSGTVTAAGVYNVTFSGLTSGTTIYITYDYQYDKPVDSYNNRDGVPEVDFSITQSSLEAIDFPVRSRYSVGAALDMMKAHGVDLEKEVVKYLGHEISLN